MSGRARRNEKAMIAALKARLAPTPRSADLPAVAQHPGLPPLDMDTLTAPIMLSPNPAQPACPPRTPPAVQRQHAPQSREREQQAAQQPMSLSSLHYMALRLAEALARRDGEQGLTKSAVQRCIERAREILSA